MEFGFRIKRGAGRFRAPGERAQLIRLIAGFVPGSMLYLRIAFPELE